MILFFFLSGTLLYSQAAADNAVKPAGNIPLKKLSLYSSGTAFFEHSITVEGKAVLALPFQYGALNDALKSLTVKDPGSTEGPLLGYASANAAGGGMKAQAADLSASPGLPEIIGRLKGEELSVELPRTRENTASGTEKITGRILASERRESPSGGEYWLSLLGPEGMRQIPFRQIRSFSFGNPRIQQDFNKALDVTMAESKTEREGREITVQLQGSGTREVSVSYVIPAPVWKISYRLDLSGDSAHANANAHAYASRLQAWAIIDNDSDTDWDQVELSLRAGRPVSFVQNLYPPFYLERPVLPLSIAGYAEAETYEQGMAALDSLMEAPSVNSMMKRSGGASPAYASEEVMASPLPAAGSPPASQSGEPEVFDFTFVKPVSIKARSGAMLLLADTSLECRKLLIFSGQKALSSSINPRLGLEIKNSSGLRLPSGPVSINDSGYAGDALLAYLSPDEKRFISYGEDLSVTGNGAASSSRILSGVKLSRGLIHVTRTQILERNYTIKNSGNEKKTIVIEHPISRGAVLTEPPSFDEETSGLYRFERTLPANSQFVFTVREETPLYERISLVSGSQDTLLSWASNMEVSSRVRSGLEEAFRLKQAADRAQAGAGEISARRNALLSEEERFRKNIETFGRDSAEGRRYIERLLSLASELDSLSAERTVAEAEAKKAKETYENYLNSLELD
ncbi:MAG: DUF4139 domain-containing protein [Treponema sp.]|nr:DUF4139 domain-containing protein [Treponema sp.]